MLIPLREAFQSRRRPAESSDLDPFINSIGLERLILFEKKKEGRSCSGEENEEAEDLSSSGACFLNSLYLL